MGTIPFDITTINNNGVRYEFVPWTTPGDLADREYGTICVEIRENGAHVLSFHITAADWDDRWFTMFCTSYAQIPDYRVKVQAWRAVRPEHPTTVVVIDGVAVTVDAGIAAALVSLNAAGAKTKFSCAGGAGSTPYILLHSGVFPPELCQAWTAAGFEVGVDAVYAHAPLCQEDEAAGGFVASLSDWMAGVLDLSGERYRLKGKRPNSRLRVPKVPEQVMSEVTNKAIRKLVAMGGRARFRDFAALASGRDRYSALKLEALRGMVDPSASELFEGLPDAAVASGLRWLLRGLPTQLAARKVKTDLEIQENAQVHRRR